MRTLIALAILSTACAQDAAGAPVSASAELGPTIPDESPPAVVVDAGWTEPVILVVDAGSPFPPGWYCCYSHACLAAGEHFCDDDEVPATNGLSTCCLPDVGQCDQ